jgi:predicted nucleic-acid-binding Zn-ribbon protein
MTQNRREQKLHVQRDLELRLVSDAQFVTLSCKRCQYAVRSIE